MNLPTTKPNDRDIAWYIRECEDLRNRLESLAESHKKQTDDYVCVDREHGLYRRAAHARDAVSADRLALALSLETLDELERENAALREDKEALDWIDENVEAVFFKLEPDKFRLKIRETFKRARAREAKPDA